MSFLHFRKFFSKKLKNPLTHHKIYDIIGSVAFAALNLRQYTSAITSDISTWNIKHHLAPWKLNNYVKGISQVASWEIHYWIQTKSSKLVLSIYHILALSIYHILVLSIYHILALSIYHILALSIYHILALSIYHILALSIYHILTLSI